MALLYVARALLLFYSADILRTRTYVLCWGGELEKALQQQTFFSTQSPRSAVKTDIVTKYFGAWSSLISKHKPALAYVDLFAGSGVYEDGVESTPIRILRLGIESEKLRQKLITVSNDVDPGAIASLRTAAQNLTGIESLLHHPRFLNAKVGDENRLAE